MEVLIIICALIFPVSLVAAIRTVNDKRAVVFTLVAAISFAIVVFSLLPFLY